MINLFLLFLRRYPGKMFLMMVTMFLSNFTEALGVSMVIPVFQQLIESKEPSGKIYEILRVLYSSINLPPATSTILAGLILVFILRAWLGILTKKLSVKISADFLFETQNKLFSSMLNSRLKFFMEEKQGVLTNAIVQENVRASNAFVSMSLWVTSILTAAVYASIAIAVSGKLAAFAVIIGIITLLPLKLVTRKARFYGERFTTLNEEIQSNLTEAFTGVKFVKGSGLEQSMIKRFEKISESFKDNWFNVAFISNSVNIYSQPIAVIVLSGILVVGKYYNLPTAELIVFLIAFQRMLPTISYAQSVKNDFDSNWPAYIRIEEIMNKSKTFEERKGGKAFVGLKENIFLDNVSFSHGEQTELFKDITLKINAHEMTSFLGHSGSGKSTLIDLILGFHEPQKGKIFFDQANLTQLDLKSLRQKISYVSQDTFLFHDTIKNNIAFENENASEEDIESVAKLAHAHEFIVGLENGYDTIVGDRGGKLSGGQKQRIALARALLKKPEILILDEATSALDYESESLIKETINNLKNKKIMTIIVIAHRLTTVKDSDKIVVIENGKIVEEGNWAELTKNEQSFISKSLKLH